jgi:glycosyltransferase involved in cell wall biosynthesis
MRPSVHILSPTAGFGNRLDLDLVAGLLEETGFRVTRSPMVKRTKLGRTQRLAGVLLRRIQRFDFNIFLAPIFPEWLPFARRNLLIPNAEGFAPHLHRFLPRIDLVLAKTRLTERVFGEIGCRTAYVGFMSRDQFDPSIPRDDTRFFHACSSQFKGTKRLLEVWQRHPEWPELLAVVNHNDTIAPDFSAPNVRLIRQALSDAEIRTLQNHHRLHICPSEAEGFGHYIMESMSCRAVVLGTDAPPMNEMITPERGMPIAPLPDPEPMSLTHRHLFDPTRLEQQVERVCAMSLADRERLGAAAREHFLAVNATFRERFPALLREMAEV